MRLPYRYQRWIPLAAMAALLVTMTAAASGWAAPSSDRPSVGVDDAAERPDRVEARVVGRIYDVSADGRSFTVGAREVSFRVEPGFGTRFPALRSGDRVLVVGTLRSQTRLTATEVRVLPGSGPRTLTGALRELDERRSRITVRVENGDTVTVEYTPDTVFARLGRRVAADQLQEGDELFVDGRWLGERLVRATRVEVTGSGDQWQRGRSGEIVGVNRRDRTLRVDFSGETRTVNVSDRTGIMRGTRDWPFDELVTGDQIRVSGELRGNAVDARRIEVTERGGPERTVEGRVRSVDPDGRILRVTLNALIPITVAVSVPSDARITRGPRRLSLNEIREGDRIRARGSTVGGRLSAESIEILP